MKEIAPAFIAARKEFAPATKDTENNFFKSKYADLAKCLEAVNKALLDNDIAVYQETFEDQTGVTVETVFLHSSGETIRGGKLHVPAPKKDPQGYGSALTYARRYSLMAACGIAAEDDDGNSASVHTQKASPKQDKPPANQAPKGKIDMETTWDELEGDAAIIAQFNAATTIPDLVKIMNSIPKDEKQLYTKRFEERKEELKKG